MRELELLTLPCLYILEVALYCRFKCELVQGRDVHQYGTRGQDNFRIQQHRTATFERLPSEVGVSALNKVSYWKSFQVNEDVNTFPRIGSDTKTDFSASGVAKR
ncbi:hypothetical protein J6590_041338 [Homalodisca vitripennis]|nr:hypothetical protein J6590_041338 [Homalodisca vitripennis]